MLTLSENFLTFNTIILLVFISMGFLLNMFIFFRCWSQTNGFDRNSPTSTLLSARLCIDYEYTILFHSLFVLFYIFFALLDGPLASTCAHRFGFSDPRVRLAAVSVGVMRRSTSVARLLHHRGRGIAVPGILVRVCSCIPAHCRSCCSRLGGIRSPAKRWHGVG